MADGGWDLRWRACQKPGCPRRFRTLVKKQKFCCLVHDPNYSAAWKKNGGETSNVKRGPKRKKTAHQKVWGDHAQEQTESMTVFMCGGTPKAKRPAGRLERFNTDTDSVKVDEEIDCL